MSFHSPFSGVSYGEKFKYDGGGGWHEEERGRNASLRLTSEQYLLKNLSSTTNKDTRPELYLIVQIIPHDSVYNWEPTNSCFPTIGRYCWMPSSFPNIPNTCTHTSKYKHTCICRVIVRDTHRMLAAR